MVNKLINNEIQDMTTSCCHLQKDPQPKTTSILVLVVGCYYTNTVIANTLVSNSALKVTG